MMGSIDTTVNDLALTGAGQARIITLAMTEDVHDPKWLAVRRTLFDAAAGLIFRHLGQRDLLLRGEDGFVLIFASTDKARAALMAEKIAESLNTRFEEDPMLRGLGIRAIERKLAREDLSERLTASLTLEKPRNGRRKDSAISQKITGIEASDRYWVYQPVWDGHTNAVVSNTALARASIPSGEFYGRGVLLENASPRDHANLDLQALGEVGAEFNNARAIGADVSVCLPVHIDGVISRETRPAYLEALAQFASGGSDKFHVLIEGIGRATSPSRIREACRALQCGGRKVGVRLPINMGRVEALKPANLAFVSIDWPSDGQDLQMGMLCDLVEEFARMNVYATLYGVTDALTVRQAVAAGVRRLAGPRIGQESVTIEPQRALSFGEIMKSTPRNAGRAAA